MSISNTKQLREFAAKQLEQLAKGEINHKQAGAAARLLGVMVSSAAAELEHCRLAGKTPSIDFLQNAG